MEVHIDDYDEDNNNKKIQYFFQLKILTQKNNFLFLTKILNNSAFDKLELATICLACYYF